MTEPILLPTGAQVQVDPAMVPTVAIPPAGPPGPVVRVAAAIVPTVITPPAAPVGPVVIPVVGPQGPVGPAGTGGFTYTQSTPAATWTITNTLGRIPSSVLILINGEVVETDVEIPDANTVVIVFASPQSGQAEIV